MTVQTRITDDDPIAPEILRTMLEAIGQEAGAAVEQTAISPIVTESKDYAVTITDADGAVLSATSVIQLHFGAAMHAIRATIAAHGDGIADGDVFLANDPHSGGGVHPQDVVIQRPVFHEGVRVAWVALSAHMMDMGGMVPGSSAPMATECYQEALRFPPVRLVARHAEVADVWNILRINIRNAAHVEMDMRSLIIGGAVAEAKLVELVAEMGLPAFHSAARSLLARSTAVLRARIGEIEDGRYRATARVEYRGGLLRFAATLVVTGERLLFDLTDAPPQVPQFFNTKPYILRAAIVPHVRELLAPGLPINQAFYDVTELRTTPGTIVDCVSPAPIGAAHMDAAMAVDAAAWQCLQFAVHASPAAHGRAYMTAPAPAAYGVGRWNYLDAGGERRIYTIMSGALCGGPAAGGRDGLDLKSGITGSASRMEYADVEILEGAYPILFRERAAEGGVHGAGRSRSGAGVREAFEPHRVDEIVGNMTGTRAWFPAAGGAGGLPGSTMRYAITRADGSHEALGMQAAGVTLRRGDLFALSCATAGGYGDPLDRAPEAVLRDVGAGRLDAAQAATTYGVRLDADGGLDPIATDMQREALRRARLAAARPPLRPAPDRAALADAPTWPFYPGVVQRGDLVLAEDSGVPLAVAPGNWLDGCPVLDTPLDADKPEGVVMRAHLDPRSGRMLFVDLLPAEEAPSIEIRPDRWMRASGGT